MNLFLMSWVHGPLPALPEVVPALLEAHGLCDVDGQLPGGLPVVAVRVVQEHAVFLAVRGVQTPGIVKQLDRYFSRTNIISNDV